MVATQPTSPQFNTEKNWRESSCFSVVPARIFYSCSVVELPISDDSVKITRVVSEQDINPLWPIRHTCHYRKSFKGDVALTRLTRVVSISSLYFRKARRSML